MFKKRSRSNNNASNSTNSSKMRKLQECILSAAKLRFCPDQLQNLNYILLKKLQTSHTSNQKSLLLARSVAERLVQRLICCAGMLDERFTSKFLVQTNDDGRLCNDLEYILRLDSLSTPQLYPDDELCKFSVIENDSDYPAAYARIRLHTSCMKMWSDCVNSAGYLRRDKVQAKLVELLAQAAAADFPTSPLNLDESIHCATPGKVVTPNTLHEILQLPTTCHAFYGPNGTIPRFPDPRDFRLAIVDEPGGARIKIEFLSPALANISMNVKILLAIGLDAWPVSTDFPARITLGHTDALLYHQAALTGMYLVGFGVQSSAWQMRVPAAQEVILSHYGPNSTVHLILEVLNAILDEMNSVRVNKKQVSYKILNSYIFLTLVLQSLEENSTTPSNDLLDWSPMYLSVHVLKILDQTIQVLQAEKLPHYFFKKSNILVNPGHLCEDDYLLEAHNVKMYILRLFDEALMPNQGDEEFEKMLRVQESETNLLHRWKELIDNLLPPLGTRGRRFCFAGPRNRQDVAHTEYTPRQLEYIGLLIEHLLNVKQKVLSSDGFQTVSDHQQDSSHLEDLIYLLVTIMDQSRDKYLSASQTNPTILKNRTKIKSQFNACTSKLVEIIRKDRETAQARFDDNQTLVKTVLKWLYKAMDQNKRCLAPILRPYLSVLFSSSHTISLHLDLIRQRLNGDEMSALGHFARLVNNGETTPAEGLIDAVNKNWMWAKDMLRMVEMNTLRVVFVRGRNQVYRHILSLPSYQRNDAANLLGDDNGKNAAVRRQNTMPSNRDYFRTILTKSGRKKSANFEFDDEMLPQHEILKRSSPLTLVISEGNRRGEHRGCGDILKSLQSMQKLNMFQQVTANLPHDERIEIMRLVQSLQQSKPKKRAKKWSTLAHISSRNNNNIVEKYTPREESAGIKLTQQEPNSDQGGSKTNNSGSLIGSCRAARIREDSSVLLLNNSFKIKTLLNKSESFKF